MDVGITAVVKKPADGSSSLNVTSPFELAATGSNITFGLIPGSQIYHYFLQSNHSIIQQMWRRMMISDPSAFESDAQSGVDRVRQSHGTYVFFLESSFAQHIASKPPCDLTYLPDLLNPSHYALAMRKGSNLKRKVDKILGNLAKSGVLERMQNKWWNKKCSKAKSVDKRKHTKRVRQQNKKENIRKNKVLDKNGEVNKQETMKMMNANSLYSRIVTAGFILLMV